MTAQVDQRVAIVAAGCEALAQSGPADPRHRARARVPCIGVHACDRQGRYSGRLGTASPLKAGICSCTAQGPSRRRGSKARQFGDRAPRACCLSQVACCRLAVRRKCGARSGDHRRASRSTDGRSVTRCSMPRATSSSRSCRDRKGGAVSCQSGARAQQQGPVARTDSCGRHASSKRCARDQAIAGLGLGAESSDHRERAAAAPSAAKRARGRQESARAVDVAATSGD